MKKLLIILFMGAFVMNAQSFSANFEKGNVKPEIGKEFIQTTNGGTVSVVGNPRREKLNPSIKCLKVTLPPGRSVRAEYQNSGRFPTEGQTHIYKWKVFYPTNFMAGANKSWMLFNQWKTWPCEEYGEGEMDYSEEICFGGGIFNDLRYDSNNLIEFRFRADPDCKIIPYNFRRNTWIEYVLEIHWSNDLNGYFNLYANRKLISSANNIKTLFDRFPQNNRCNIYFSVGLYAGWSSTGATSIYYYVDDIQVYDKPGVKIEDVLK